MASLGKDLYTDGYLHLLVISLSQLLAGVVIRRIELYQIWKFKIF
jgi:hypothetical protein